MNQAWFWDRLQGWREQEAIVGDGWRATYGELLDDVAVWRSRLAAAEIQRGQVVAFDGDYGPRTVSLLLALIAQSCIAVPLASAEAAQKTEFMQLAFANFFIDCRALECVVSDCGRTGPRHMLLETLATAGDPGLVLFSSGSTGRPKAMLHNATRLLEKFRQQRSGARILTFLLLDHIGGVNTLWSGLANGGTVITVATRDPASICQAIARHRVDVLPTSPTFLNLLLLSGEYRRHDLSSLRLITYGTEVMPESTLARLHESFPHVRLQQTYGLSELGILRSKSREDGSLWVKVGGDDYETKLVDGILWIRSKTAMLGYLNADNPFDAEGWFNTQDAVDQDGEWLRFRGRTSELINVGGQKVYPAEVESVLLEMDNVRDVTVHGEHHPLVGQCVVARVNLEEPESILAFKTRMQQHCRGRLARYMIPVKIELATHEQYGARCKRMRQV